MDKVTFRLDPKVYKRIYLDKKEGRNVVSKRTSFSKAMGGRKVHDVSE